MDSRKKSVTIIALFGAIAVTLIIIFGTLWIGQSAREDSGEVARTVSLLYLDELAGRREQVVADNLQARIDDLHTALELMSKEDLSDVEHLQAYQAKMKKLLTLERFAFVDTEGLIYTSTGTQSDIDEYQFDRSTLSGPEVSIKNLNTKNKKVIIATPLDHIPFNGDELVVCFMEIDMKEMLQGISIHSQNSSTTFSNIYTTDGVALTDMILGGLAEEDNLITALETADYEKGYSYEKVKQDFEDHVSGQASFTYRGIRETLSYTPVQGTDWMLTYLIRESVISNQISSISQGILLRSILQSVLTALVLIGVFTLIILQNRKNAALRIEKETADAETRIKQQELDERIAMQEKIEEQSHALSEALSAAENANKAKTVFLSNMSHEIRTPMNAIIGLDNIALNDPDTPPKTREYLEKIGVSAEHLLNLINDILDMFRIESGRMVLKNEEFSFQQLLEAINTMFSGQCADKGLDYQCHAAGQLSDYYIGDNMKLRQVLINILGNAVKFTPESGKITFVAEEIQRNDGQAVLKFSISDTGIGMSPEFLPKLFDTFSQEDSTVSSKYGSTGLGMPITRNIVRLMNGTIDVQSTKGAGSTFTVTLPLGVSDRIPKESGADGAVPDDHLKGRRILLAEDMQINAEILMMILSMREMETDHAENGRIAVELYMEKPEGYYDAVLMDMRMPEMNGLEAAQAIRGAQRRDSSTIPIIALTANAFDDDVQRSLQAGLNAHLSKPVDTDVLYATLEKLIN
ncbi:MAG: response regulator [Lachnospiraceae bacterium]|nr:response regulator [Lachnospiraceae bacterium]